MGVLSVTVFSISTSPLVIPDIYAKRSCSVQEVSKSSSSPYKVYWEAGLTVFLARLDTLAFINLIHRNLFTSRSDLLDWFFGDAAGGGGFRLWCNGDVRHGS